MNPYLSAVNQNLFFCKLLLKQGLPKKEAAEDNQSVQLEIALCQSALYQLECAYGHYLREIAQTYQYKSAEHITTVEELVSALASINKQPGEAQEIQCLLENNHSWLSQMLSAYQQLSLLPNTQVANIAHPSPIALVEVKSLDDRIALDYQQLEAWQKSFVEMVNRHREMMVEC
jgi:hypothetical protein